MSNNNLITREPALTVGLVNARIAAAVGFGLDLPAEQVGLINAAVIAVLSFLTRQQVTANANVVERKAKNRVVAGKANELVEPGTTVRFAGTHAEKDSEEDYYDDEGL